MKARYFTRRNRQRVFNYQRPNSNGSALDELLMARVYHIRGDYENQLMENAHQTTEEKNVQGREELARTMPYFASMYDRSRPKPSKPKFHSL